MRTLALLSVLALAAPAWAATLTITPDKSVYRIGERITLDVLGMRDPFRDDNAVFGRLLFDAGLADWVASTQEPLRRESGASWFVFALEGGKGFADAFSQSPGGSPREAVNPLVASVTLRATSEGVLAYAWLVGGRDLNINLDFFGLTNAPGGSVRIVPEPGTASLVCLGLAALAVGGGATAPWQGWPPA